MRALLWVYVFIAFVNIFCMFLATSTNGGRLPPASEQARWHAAWLEVALAVLAISLLMG